MIQHHGELVRVKVARYLADMIGQLKKKLTTDLRLLYLGAALAGVLLVCQVPLRPVFCATAQPPLWPLDLPTRYLTSNFMEYRSGRFHAGLDLKTQSQEGFSVLAVEDGWISRVRVNPRAYGRAVYLRGQSGMTYVYAHLGRFNDKIRARVDAARGTSGRYEASLYLDPGDLPVRRGEILGLSGQSGTSGPHLHFEVRDEQQHPLNPLDHGFAVADTFPPVFEAIRAIRVSPYSLLEGGTEDRLLIAGEGPQNLDLRGRLPLLHLFGPVAFSARIVDKSDIRDHRLEPWLVEVRLDGQMVYRCCNESYAFDQNSLQRLEWLAMPGIRERWLHRRSGNVLAGRWGELWYLGEHGQGLSPGNHELEIVAWDQAGNEQAVTVPLLVEDRPPAVSEVMDTPLAWLAEPLTVRPRNLNHETTRALTPFFEILDEGWEPEGRRLLTPTQGDPVLAPVILWTVAVALDSVALRQADSQGLIPAGPAADFLAADWPIEAAVAVGIPGDAQGLASEAPTLEEPRLGVYRWHRDKWHFAADPLEVGQDVGQVGGKFRFALSDPGFHAVFTDTLAPCFDCPGQPGERLVIVPGPQGDLPGLTLPRWEVFALGLVDAGSGIDSATLRATLDGRSWVVEPDLPRDRILVELPSDLAPGHHSFRVEVADGAKNQASFSIGLDCRE